MVPMINLDKCLNLQVCLLRPEKIKIKVSTLLDKVVKQLKCVFGFFLFFFLLFFCCCRAVSAMTVRTTT